MKQSGGKNRSRRLWITVSPPPPTTLFPANPYSIHSRRRKFYILSSMVFPSWRRFLNPSAWGSQRDVVYLGWPIAPSYMSPKNAVRGGGGQGLSQWVQLCTWSPNILWRSYSIFNLCPQHNQSLLKSTFYVTSPEITTIFLFVFFNRGGYTYITKSYNSSAYRFC